MPRIARIVVPGLPHHVTQRGNRREPIFFERGDQDLYRQILAEQTRRAGVECWAYCLMPNHVHLVLTPNSSEGLGRAVGEAHRRYSMVVNERRSWIGHLFQSRFASAPMDDRYFRAALAYVSLNPVRAGLVARAEDWPWSSVRAHLAGRDDALVRTAPVIDRGWDFRCLMQEATDRAAYEALRKAEGTGRPLGSTAFVEDLERQLGRPLAPRSAGCKSGTGSHLA